MLNLTVKIRINHKKRWKWGFKMVEAIGKCDLCSKSLLSGIPLKDIEPDVQKNILKDHPELTLDSIICFSHVMDYRLAHIKTMIKSDSKEMQVLNETVFNSIKEGNPVSKNMNEAKDDSLTAGQRTADAIAKFGGSWPFIFSFVFVLVAWITINSMALLGKAFDPYPFILLNLVLSCLAAIQAPVIMMSQNRQAERDRMQTTNDYQTNLKAEIEIRLLHQKLDHLLTNEWQHLIEIQTIQLSLLEELQKQVDALEVTEKVAERYNDEVQTGG